MVGVAIYTDASCNKYFCVGHDLKKGELDKTYREIKMDVEMEIEKDVL